MPIQMDSQPLAMSRLEQERDDGADDEDRLEPFAQDDEETLKERFRSAPGGLRQLDDAFGMFASIASRARSAPRMSLPGSRP